MPAELSSTDIDLSQAPDAGDPPVQPGPASTPVATAPTILDELFHHHPFWWDVHQKCVSRLVSLGFRLEHLYDIRVIQIRI